MRTTKLTILLIAAGLLVAACESSSSKGTLTKGDAQSSGDTSSGGEVLADTGSAGDEGPAMVDEGPAPTDEGPAPTDEGPAPTDEGPEPTDVGPADEGPADPGSAEDTGGDPCAGLDEEACKADPACAPILGAPAEEICADNFDSWMTIFSGCMPSDMGCGDAETCAVHPDGDPKLIFPSTCTPDGWSTPEWETCCPAPVSASIKGAGSSFGMCVGACKTDLKIDGEALDIRTSGHDGTEYQHNTGTLTAAGLTTAGEIAAALVGVELQQVYGCPDCADGGAYYVVLLRGGVESTHTYGYGTPPEVLEAIDTFTKGLIEGLLTCASGEHLSVGEGCVPRDL